MLNLTIRLRVINSRYCVLMLKTSLKNGKIRPHYWRIFSIWRFFLSILFFLLIPLRIHSRHDKAVHVYESQLKPNERKTYNMRDKKHSVKTFQTCDIEFATPRNEKLASNLTIQIQKWGHTYNLKCVGWP